MCPHAAIRLKLCDPDALAGVDLPSKTFRAKEHPGLLLTIQAAPDDCTGCGVCVDVCPAKSKSEVKHKALDMMALAPIAEQERTRWQTFLDVTPVPARHARPRDHEGFADPRTAVRVLGRVRGLRRDAVPEAADATVRRPPDRRQRHRLLVDLRRQPADDALVDRTPTAAAPHGRTRCSRTTPSSASAFASRSTARSTKRSGCCSSSRRCCPAISRPRSSQSIRVQRPTTRPSPRNATVSHDSTPRCATLDDPRARLLAAITGALVRKSVWIVGGDGWAYDIGAGGLDHVLGSGRDVNVLVLDTEVYSNTGGQASKATPRGATAKFATSGKSTAKKDIGAEARRYGDVYIAQIAIGANDVQTVKAFAEAEAWPGVSIIVAYSTCIAHGIDMTTSMSHQRDAVKSGYWPLYRYKPSPDEHAHPFQLDARPPSMPVADFAHARSTVRGAGAHASRTRGRAAWRSRSPTSTNGGATTNSSQASSARSRTRNEEGSLMVDLRTRYLGLDLDAPIVASAGPLTGRLETLRRLEEAGAAAVVLPSLFEEDIVAESRLIHAMLSMGAGASGEAETYLPGAARRRHRAGTPRRARARREAGVATSR